MRELNLPKKFRPDYSESFREESGLMDAVQATEAQTEWLTVDNSSVGFRAAEESGVNGEIQDFLMQSGAIALYLDVRGALYPISPTALESLKCRCSVDGPGFKRLLNAEAAAVFSLFFSRIKESQTVLLVRRGLVYGFNSSRYIQMPAETVITSARCAAENRFGTTRFVSGLHSNLVTIANYELPDIADEFVEKYQEAVRSCAEASAEVMPTIEVITSDTGMHTASIRPCLMQDGRKLYFGGNVSIRHDSRSGEGIKDFGKEAETILAKLNEVPKAVKKLADTKITYGEECITNVIRRLNGSGSVLPLSLARSAVEDCRIIEENCGTISAYTVYLCLSSIPSMARDSGRYPFSSIILMEETVARALKFKWEEFDSPVCKKI